MIFFNCLNCVIYWHNNIEFLWFLILHIKLNTFYLSRLITLYFVCCPKSVSLNTFEVIYCFHYLIAKNILTERERERESLFCCFLRHVWFVNCNTPFRETSVQQCYAQSTYIKWEAVMHFALGFINIASVYNKKKIMRILTQI